MLRHTFQAGAAVGETLRGTEAGFSLGAPQPRLDFLNGTTSLVPRPGLSPVGTPECQVDWEGP